MTAIQAEVERVSAVATHYDAAGDQAAALRATVAAARQAAGVYAYGEMADLADRALELWPRVSEQARPPDVDHVDLLVLAARAHGMGGDRARSEVLQTARARGARRGHGADPLRSGAGATRSDAVVVEPWTREPCDGAARA